MKDKSNSQAIWDAVAEKYEAKFMTLEIYNATYQLFTQHLPSKKPSLFDIGCGPGNISHFLKQQLPNATIQGIDTSAKMVELAKKNVLDSFFYQMDSRMIGSLTDRFHGIICGFCIPYLAKAETEKFLEDCNHILLPNGVLYLSFVDGNYQDSQYVGGSTGHQLFFHYYDSGFLINKLEKLGFSLLESLTVPYSKAEGEMETHHVLILRK